MFFSEKKIAHQLRIPSAKVRPGGWVGVKMVFFLCVMHPCLNSGLGPGRHHPRESALGVGFFGSWTGRPQQSTSRRVPADRRPRTSDHRRMTAILAAEASGQRDIRHAIAVREAGGGGPPSTRTGVPCTGRPLPLECPPHFITGPLQDGPNPRGLCTGCCTVRLKAGGWPQGSFARLPSNRGHSPVAHATGVGPPPHQGKERSCSPAVMHVTPELEVLGSNLHGELSRNAAILGARDSMIPRAGRNAAARDKE